MRKLLFLVSFLPLLGTAQDKAKTFKLSGKTKDLAFKPEWVLLQYRVDGEWKTDSVKANDGKYSFTGKIAEPVTGRLRVKYAANDKGNKTPTVNTRDAVTVFLQPGKIKVNSEDSFSNIQVKGSAAHTEYMKLTAKNKPYDTHLTRLYEEYTAYGKVKDKENQEKTEKKIDDVNAVKRENVYGEYVRNNPSSPIGLYALQQYAGWDIDADKVEPLFNTLSEGNKNYPSAKRFMEEIAIAKKTGIGKYAMDFTQNDTLGNPVMLSSLRGKYLLVDFWASWCGPCRAENPNVVKVYNKYKDRNFHIIGVSLDRPGQKEKWMKAIHDDELAWTHVSDLKFWDNEVAKQYGIKAIPQNLLLDPEGKIIAKNLRGDDLDLELGKAIDGKKGF
jgi:peroxiredoxin